MTAPTIGFEAARTLARQHVERLRAECTTDRYAGPLDRLTGVQRERLVELARWERVARLLDALPEQDPQ